MNTKAYMIKDMGLVQSLLLVTSSKYPLPASDYNSLFHSIGEDKLDDQMEIFTHLREM